MSAITITLTNICSGGGHLTFTATGDATGQRVIDLDVLTQPIEEQDIEAFLRVIVKLARKGRTQNQARILLQNGVQVTV